MTTTERFARAGDALADRDTGLEWGAAPTALRLPWADAAAAAMARGQRLPTTGELMTLLAGLPPTFPGLPASADDALWSTSASPFAPQSRVRAVACDGPGRFVVVLLERTTRARWWGVRSPGG